MWQSIYDRYNEREIAAYREGAEEALRFKANHGDIHQDLFRAETDQHKLYIGYDDVEFGVFLEITFKQRWDREGNAVKVMVSRGRFNSCLERALDFLSRHPYERPYCNVDY